MSIAHNLRSADFAGFAPVLYLVRTWILREYSCQRSSSGLAAILNEVLAETENLCGTRCTRR
jgi:hypothetical protein